MYEKKKKKKGGEREEKTISNQFKEVRNEHFVNERTQDKRDDNMTIEQFMKMHRNLIFDHSKKK